MTIQQLATSKPLNKNAKERLSLSGIDFDKNPTITNFPKFYNRMAHSLWAKVLSEMDFVASTQANWQTAMKDFQDLCNASDVDVFDEDTLDTYNESIADSLKANRLQAIKCGDDTGIFDHFTIRSVIRRVAVLSGQDGKNFYVQNEAKLQAVKDPTLESWLLSSPLPGFFKAGERSYEKLVNAATLISINFSSKTNASISLRIECHSMPMIPHKKTTQSMARFIESKIWDPLVQRYRFKGAKNKMF